MFTRYIVGRFVVWGVWAFAAVPAWTAADGQAPGIRTVRHQVVGMFSEERVQDLRALFGEKLPKFTLVETDFMNAEITVAFDPAQTWPGEKPERELELLNNTLRNASRGTFGVKPRRSKPAEAYVTVEILVAGLDCKGCELGAYRLIEQIPGVETVHVSFRSGKILAVIEPARTDAAKLVAALKQGGVEVQVQGDGEPARP